MFGARWTTLVALGLAARIASGAPVNVAPATLEALRVAGDKVASGYPDWDERTRTAMLTTWRYRPFEINGHVAAVCTAITHVYKNPNPPPRSYNSA